MQHIKDDKKRIDRARETCDTSHPRTFHGGRDDGESMDIRIHASRAGFGKISIRKRITGTISPAGRFGWIKTPRT